MIRKLLLAAAASVALAPAAVAADIASALADPGRPAADVARDGARKPAAVIAFAGIKPGDRVTDFIPGGGYFTRIFSGVVGPKGHVYAMVPGPAAAFEAPMTATITTFAATHPNVTVVITKGLDFAAPDGPVDVFWTAQNYHDLYNPLTKGAAGPTSLLPLNKLVFAALKPGGTYFIIDHVAPAGSGISDTNTLHRIDPARVRADVEGAGFVFVGESDVLRNPADPHDKIVFDPSIRGHTDQFVYKFRKPG
ncbi:MAG TPA: methyltransferase [Caulobacteraceae bacterium]|jgi:predicted methyltransferase